jgi:predicted GTPase
MNGEKTGKKKVIIVGAAGRDFWNFLSFFKKDPSYEVVAFTATQIPGIANKIFPPELAGKNYPKGIPIYPEKELPSLIKKFKADFACFSYSDVSHERVMHLASIANAFGAHFLLLSPISTMAKSRKKVIAVTAVRTGSGKSPLTRRIASILVKAGKKVAIIRHPMPYGDLKVQAVQAFEKMSDLEKHKCTIEEREEYESIIKMGIPLFAGIDYKRILERAEEKADVVIWDGGNNDTSFILPDLQFVVADSLRSGHELLYHPGETNFRMADVIVINKVNEAKKKDIETILENAKNANPGAIIMKAKSVLVASGEMGIAGKRVLCVEDGPTVTHGGLNTGAAFSFARRMGAKPVSPVKYAVGSIKKTFEQYPHISNVLPAMGYSKKQMDDLQKTINRVDADLILIGTPIDLSSLIHLNKPSIKIDYALEEVGKPTVKDVLRKFGFV